MAFRREDLTYCTNVHPGQTADEILQNLERYVSEVKRRRGLTEMAVGIWIGARALQDLEDQGLRQRFKECLQSERLWPTSINGFPYGSFHRDRIKEEVYEPAWDSPERLAYTLGLADLATELLGNAPSGFRQCSVSTVPLGFRYHWNPSRHSKAIRNLIEAERHYARMSANSGIGLSLGLEMEPGCALEKTADVLSLWQDLRAGGLHRIDTGDSGDGSLLHLGLCYDVCHQAVMFEDISESLLLLREAKIPIFKYQISSALRVLWPAPTKADDPEESPHRLADLEARLAPFCEKRYLHQTSVREAIQAANSPEDAESGSAIRFFLDLDQALADGARRGEEWRVHFHVPVHLDRLDSSGETDAPHKDEAGLYTTRRGIEEALSFLADATPCPASAKSKPVLEVETYTWEVLPESVRSRYGDLPQAIVQEVAWLEQSLQERQMLQDSDQTGPEKNSSLSTAADGTGTKSAD